MGPRFDEMGPRFDELGPFDEAIGLDTFYENNRLPDDQYDEGLENFV